MSLTPQELAEAQAAKDAELMASLREKAAVTGEAFVLPEDQTVEDFLATREEATEPYQPLNRAQRRALVSQFKANLRMLPRQQPVRNPTVRARKH